MKILGLDSSGLVASVAVVENDVLLAEYTTDYKKTHSQTLLPMLEELRNMIELDMDTIDAIAIASGPGSFTGLRIGVSAVKGLAWAAEMPCIPVSTLEAMAWPLAHLEGNVVCAMDARRQQIYNAVFLAEGGSLTRLRADRAVSLEETAADLEELDGPMVIVGDGAKLCFDFLTSRGVPCDLAPGHLRLQSAVGVAMAAWRRWPEGCVSAQELTPTYLRLSQAERERLARETGGCRQ